MNRLSRCLALAAALMSLTLAVTAGAGGFAGYAKHHFIVRFEPGYAPSGVKSAGGLVPDDPRLRTLMETHRVRGLEQAYPTAPVVV